MSEYSEFSLGKISALSEQIRKEFKAYVVRVHAYSHRFSLEIGLENFPLAPDDVVSLQNHVLEYFSINKTDAKIELTRIGFEIKFSNNSIEVRKY